MNDHDYFINHRYKEHLIIPYVGINDNCRFFFDKEERYVITSDHIRCKVVNCKEKHICDLEDEIRKIYNLDVWSFIKKWYKACPYMDSMHFIVLDLKKEE